MEYIWNQTSDKYIVTLGGVRWNNCSVDADCPGYALCARNQSWQEDPATCHCPLNRFVDGPNCDETLSSLFSIHTCYLLFKVNKGRLDPSTVTLIFATIGAVAEVGLAGTLAYQPFRREEPNPITGDRNMFNLGLYITIPFVFGFSTLAAMNVSLVWLKIADNAIRMKQNTSIDLVGHRRAVLLYYAILLTLICVGLGLQQITQVIIFAMYGVFVVGATYTYALYKIGNLIKSFSSNSGSHDHTGNELDKSGVRMSTSKASTPTGLSSPTASAKETKDKGSERPTSVGPSNGSGDGRRNHVHGYIPKYRNPIFKYDKNGDNMKNSLRNIRVLSVRMIIASYLYFLSLGLYLRTGGANVTPATDLLYNRLTYGFIWFENLVLITFTVAYLRETAVKRYVKASQERSATSNGNEAAVAVRVDSNYPNGTGTLVSSNKASKEEMI